MVLQKSRIVIITSRQDCVFHKFTYLQMQFFFQTDVNRNSEAAYEIEFLIEMVVVQNVFSLNVFVPKIGEILLYYCRVCEWVKRKHMPIKRIDLIGTILYFYVRNIK